MYVLLFLLLGGAGGVLFATGVRRSKPGRIALGVLTIAGTFLFFQLLELWAEMLWFDSIGHAARFWTLVWARVQAIALGVGIAVPGVAFLRRGLPARNAVKRWVPLVAAGAIGVLWGWELWDELLLFRNGAPTGLVEPVLGRDVAFYLFRLPLLDALRGLLLAVAGIGLVSCLGAMSSVERGKLRLGRPGPELYAPLRRTLAFLAVVLAGTELLAVFHLLYSRWGVVAGPGWTDVHVRLPAYLVVAALTLVLGCLPMFRRAKGEVRARTLLKPWLAIGAASFLGLVAAPGLVQWLVVEPNEITFEKPYIAHNIEATRRGFRLDHVEERSFPVGGDFTPDDAAKNEALLSEVRLWDYRALASVYKQFQEIRLYYEFSDVDIDRYRLGDRYRQVMVSARELDQRNLPAQSQTFVNQRFKYTHGYGLTLAAVTDFTPQGLPNLLVKDIPPRSTLPELAVERPQIYYGELTWSPAVVNTSEEEFDYPSGDENVYIRYPGKGGIRLANLWRKFVFGWRFDGTRFLLSSYPGPDTRVMIHRQVRERVATLAPFLDFDDDPYIVLSNGRLYWIVDGYTSSTYYPYSEPFSSLETIEYGDGGRSRTLTSAGGGDLHGVNYVRNSVKAVVDAFDGTVDLYAFEPDDPLITAWSAAFPGLFQPRDAMPAELRAHVRYPEDFLHAQGMVYAKYHMTDPEVFYNQEDLWVRATEKYYAAVQPVEPYYVMWQQPGSENAEFVLILPFTPKNRQVLIGWIAGMCDGDDYGRFLAYKFPKEERVLGPQQVETKIDQDRFLSGQLTLWDQRGSHVIRGNVLAIPIADTLLYVEPIYLQAETAAYPELRLVVVMQGDEMSYANTFDEALQGLFRMQAGEAPPPLAGETASQATLIERANAAFEAYLKATGERRFEDAAEELEHLRKALEELAAGAGQGGSE